MLILGKMLSLSQILSSVTHVMNIKNNKMNSSFISDTQHPLQTDLISFAFQQTCFTALLRPAAGNYVIYTMRTTSPIQQRCGRLNIFILRFILLAYHLSDLINKFCFPQCFMRMLIKRVRKRFRSSHSIKFEYFWFVCYNCLTNS